MPLIATGINKLLTFKKQTGLGVIATASGAQNMRRVTSSLDYKKATFESKEIRPSQQTADYRHGVVGVDGTIAGEVSVGTHQSFIESLCRMAAAPAVSSTGVTDCVAASTGTNIGTFTTTAGLFVTGVATTCLKIGMVVRATGFTTTATANNAANFLITNIDPTKKILTVARLDGLAIVAKTETGSVVFAEVGKHVIFPQSGFTRDYYTIEHNFTDIVQSERYTDCVISQMDVKLPATGMATVDFQVKGLKMTTGTTGYFTAPTAVSTGTTLAAANGALYLGGVAIGLITAMNFSAKGNYTLIGGVVGSNTEPDIFPGGLDADGQITVLFTDAVVRDYFINETEVAILAVFTTDNSPTSGFVAYNFPRVKMGGASKDDGEKGLVMTMPFKALENVNGGSNTNSQQTTFVLQDSAFV
jgi:hypothetical protein